MVLGLDLTELRRAYFGVGKRAFPPELMLMVVLYEMHSGQLHPVRWAKDCRWFDPVKWLAMGFEPSPSYFYSFRKRLGAPLRAWNQQVLDRALAEGWTKGDETSIDGTFVAALGSRHRLIKAKTFAQRVETLRAALAADGRAARAPAADTGSRSDGAVTSTTLVGATATPVVAPSPQRKRSRSRQLPRPRRAPPTGWPKRQPVGAGSCTGIGRPKTVSTSC